jgi:iron complex transport system substrate-binding protein
MTMTNGFDKHIASFNRRSRRRHWRSFGAILGVTALVIAGQSVYERFLETQAADTSERTSQDMLPGAGARPIEVIEEGDGYRVVRHAGGVTRIPSSPQRICALAAADELLSIGVKPVAHSIKDGNFPDYLAETLKDVSWIPNVYGDAMPNLEAIIQVQPDLIITRAPDRQTFLQLSKIAPVVVLLGHSHHYRQRVLDVGVLVGHQHEAEVRVAWYDAKVLASRKVLHAKLHGQTFAFFRVNPRAFRMSGRGDSGGPVPFGDLQLPPPRLVAENERNITLSPEQLIDLDADYAVVAVDEKVGSVRNMHEILEHPAWQWFPAGKNGHAMIVTRYRHWADSGILGKSLIIDDVLRAVAPEALEAVNAEALEAMRRQALSSMSVKEFESMNALAATVLRGTGT